MTGIDKELYSNSFTGCLEGITFGQHQHIQIDDLINYDGVNIGSCDYYEDPMNEIL